MHPILFRIGSFEIGTYGLMMAIGFLVALWLAKLQARRDGMAPEAIVDLSITLLIAGVLGAKLLMVIVDLFNGEPMSSVFSLGTLRAGGAIHGGILLGAAAFYWRIKHLKLPLAKTLDVITSAVPIGQAIGRIGCIMAGCCYGAYCELPWAIAFHDHEAARFGTPLDLPLHPVQFYFCLSNLAIFAILAAFGRRRKFFGQISALYFVLEGAFRIVLETWRGDLERGFWLNSTWLSTGRITGILFVLIGIAIWYFCARAAKRVANK
jgi:phosphatidylglycerol:prolipoprotein diacylglycerol transferase